MPTITLTPTIAPTLAGPVPLSPLPEITCVDGTVVAEWTIAGTPRNYQALELNRFAFTWHVYNQRQRLLTSGNETYLAVTAADAYRHVINVLDEPWNALVGDQIIISFIIYLDYGTGSDQERSPSAFLGHNCRVTAPLESPTPTTTATNTPTTTRTITPTATPAPVIIVELILPDGSTIPTHRMVIRGTEVTVQATFRYFHGAHRFNMALEKDDASAVAGADCYGDGMIVVRSFTAAGDDVVRTGTVLDTCPVGEYDVIVNQVDGGGGVARSVAQPMPVVSAQPTGSGRMVDLTVDDVGYDDYRYRFVGGGIVGPWVVTKPLTLKAMPVDPLFGNAVRVDLQGCNLMDASCRYLGPVGSAHFTLQGNLLRQNPMIGASLNVRVIEPRGAASLSFEWDVPDPLPSDNFVYDWYFVDVETNGTLALDLMDSGLTRRLTFKELDPATEYQFCVRAADLGDFGGPTSATYQCTEGIYTAPVPDQVPPPIGPVFVDCTNASVSATWLAPSPPAGITLVRFDYTWAGARTAMGNVPFVVAMSSYSTTTSMYQAGDAVDFSVAAIYEVGGINYRSLYAHASGICTVPHLTDPTVDLWVMVYGLRSDVDLVVDVGTAIEVFWRTTGATDVDLDRGLIQLSSAAQIWPACPRTAVWRWNTITS